VSDTLPSDSSGDPDRCGRRSDGLRPGSPADGLVRPSRGTRHGAAAGQRIIQRGAFHAKGAAHRRFAHPALQRDGNTGPLFVTHRAGTASTLAPPHGRCDTGPHPFLRQGPLIRCQRPKHTKEEGPLGRGGIHLRRQGAQGHALGLERRSDLEQVRQGAPEPIQFPDDEAIARLDIGQGLPEPGALIASATGVITERLSENISWHNSQFIR
jgi:hypothetical protein